MSAVVMILVGDTKIIMFIYLQKYNEIDGQKFDQLSWKYLPT